MQKSVIAVLSCLLSLDLLAVAVAGTLACDEKHDWAATHGHASVSCGDHHSAPFEGSQDEDCSPCLVHLCTCGHVSEQPHEFGFYFVPSAGLSLQISGRVICPVPCSGAIDRPPRTIV